ncbi:MAG: nuclear transport factor 2 family protein [Acidobacteria bacterium]|nr:nuclear transport factor 2 family protein [Acidobacteriota bacterium]
MRFLLLTMGLLVAMPLMAASAEEEVKTAEHAWLDGITKNDFPKLEKVLADDLFYLHSTGVVDTKASYIGSMKSGKQRYAAGKINDLKVRIYGTTAVINGDANFEFITDGKPGKSHLKYTHVFVKGGKGWQLVSHQSLKVAD